MQEIIVDGIDLTYLVEVAGVSRGDIRNVLGPKGSLDLHSVIEYLVFRISNKKDREAEFYKRSDKLLGEIRKTGLDPEEAQVFLFARPFLENIPDFKPLYEAIDSLRELGFKSEEAAELLRARRG